MRAFGRDFHLTEEPATPLAEPPVEVCGLPVGHAAGRGQCVELRVMWDVLDAHVHVEHARETLRRAGDDAAVRTLAQVLDALDGLRVGLERALAGGHG